MISTKRGIRTVFQTEGLGARAPAGALSVSLVVAVLACVGEFTPEVRTQVVRSIDSATSAFLTAERARDAGRIIEHLAPDFFMYQDGDRVGYEAVVEQIRSTMPSIQAFETEWDPIDILALGRDHGIATFRFRDSIILGDGAIVQTQGPTTLVWRRRGEDWLLIFADADHYPVSPR